MPGVVDLWEAGLGRPSVERGLRYASVPAEAPVGERNAALLALRGRLFGPHVEALARCPACGEASEVSFSLDDLAAGSSEGGVFEFEGSTLEWRRPNSLDLAYAMRFTDEDEAARAIARRCVVSASPEGVSDLALVALGAHIDANDPLAAPTFSVACPECGEPSDFLLDLVDFVGREIATAARRALADVHELARAYGWTEGETLSLSPTRRRMYLEMVRA